MVMAFGLPLVLELTVPAPVPVTLTVRVFVIRKVAVTLVAPAARVHGLVVPVQVPLPPLHPVKKEFAPAVAARATGVVTG